MKKITIIFFTFLICFKISSQEIKRPKTQPTEFLSNFYYSVNFGGIFYPFSNNNLVDGYKTDTFSKNYFSGKIGFGYKLKENLALQFGVIRPASWFKYNNINNIGYERSVWINAWFLSLKRNFKLNKKLSIYGEIGGVNVTRVGFEINNNVIYPDAHFGSVIYGLGFNYKLNERWKLSLNGTFIPESKKNNQPSISQTSFGFEYHIQKIPKKLALDYNNDARYFFPDNILQVSYGTSKIGFGANKFFSMNVKIGNFESFGIPIFWLGEVKAAHSFSITYQRLAFRTQKLFSLDWGVSVTAFQTEALKENVFAFFYFSNITFLSFKKKRL